MNGFEFIQDLAVILAVGGVTGWVCQRLGLSVVAGFLMAGMAIGPHAPALGLVADVARIETLAQLGLVFLMFAIGLQLSVRKLRRLGLSLVLATATGAIAMYHGSRMLAAALGWTATEGLFLAGMLMVSSSAIIGRILQETGTNHERCGQLGMGVSVLEDVVAVAMLTLLGSMVQLGHGRDAAVGETLLLLGAFVVVAGIAGLLLVPWLLRRMSVAADEELQTLGLAGLLFALAVVAHLAGYSLALGAFLLGTIVAETPHRHQVERTFEGMRGVFSAVFFVAIGLQIDGRTLAAEAATIAGVAAFALVARPLAVAAGLMLIGSSLKEALRTGMTVTPLGEFSFIIAQVGVAAGAVPPRFQPLAVGVSLLTTLAAPVAMRNSEKIATAVEARQPRWLADWLRAYQRWLERWQYRKDRNRLWQISRKRIVQVGVGGLFVTGLVVFSGRLFDVVVGSLKTRLPEPVLVYGFWVAVTLVVLAPLVAIWRNLAAMAMVYAEVSTQGHPHAKRLRPTVETVLKTGFGVAIYLWLTAIVPAEGSAKWLLAVSGVAAVAALIVLRRKLIYWHSEMEVEIMSVIESGDSRMTATTAPWLQPHQEWNLQMIDGTLPDLAECQGKTIAELDLRGRFGCAVVGIERQGYMMPLPPGETVLYPRDKVLLLGTAEQVRAGKAALGAVAAVPAADSTFAEVRMEAVTLPSGSPAADRTIAELGIARIHGVQVAGLRRGTQRVLNPAADARLKVGDEILALGTPDQIAGFKVWLHERSDGTAEEPSA